MTRLTMAQMAQVARAGGLPGDPALWAAVGMAESAGDPLVVNSIGCVGLWQINQPVHIRSHPAWTVRYLQNPLNNARAAAVIYHAQGMDAWEGYTGPSGHGSDGPWKQYYSQAKQADWWDPLYKLDPFGLIPGNPDGSSPGNPFGGDPPYGGTVDAASGIATGIGGITEAVQKTAVWMGNSQNWVRVAYVTGGAVLMLLGLTIVARPLISGTPAAAAAKTAAGVVKKAASKPMAKPKTTSRKGTGGE